MFSDKVVCGCEHLGFHAFIIVLSFSCDLRLVVEEGMGHTGVSLVQDSAEYTVIIFGHAHDRCV